MITSFPVTWFVKAVSDHDHVETAAAINDHEVRIVRKEFDPITVVPVKSNFLVLYDVEEVLAFCQPTLVVLINPSGHYAWDARRYAESHGASVQTMSELYTFLPEEDPRHGVDKKVDFVRRRLEQHTRVNSVSMICEATMQVSRNRPLEPLQIAVEYQYEFTEEALVDAKERHPDVDIIYNANPNGTVTEAAFDHATHAGVEVLGFKELMSRMHRP